MLAVKTLPALRSYLDIVDAIAIELRLNIEYACHGNTRRVSLIPHY